MRNIWAFAWGGLVGILGGLIGLGGAEFRLPVLVSIFHYRTLEAIIINLIVSLVTVIFSLFFRGSITGYHNIINHLPIILNILAGSLIGSYVGVNYATRIDEKALNKIVVFFLFFISLILLGHDFIFRLDTWQFSNLVKIVSGFLAGLVIGIFSSMLGVAGGELIIPTIILIFGINIKLAGSLSLAISIPTIMMGLFKYKKRKGFQEIESEKYLMINMASGSILGALIGSYLFKYTSSSLLHVILGIILLISAFKLAKHTPFSV